MNFAYDWAFAKPVRKVYYNLTITGLSVFVAFFIGAVETVGPRRPRTATSAARSGRSSRASTSTRPGFFIVGRLRGDLGRGAGHLALRAHRGQMGHGAQQARATHRALETSVAVE